MKQLSQSQSYSQSPYYFLFIQTLLLLQLLSLDPHSFFDCVGFFPCSKIGKTKRPGKEVTFGLAFDVWSSLNSE